MCFQTVAAGGKSAIVTVALGSWDVSSSGIGCVGCGPVGSWGSLVGSDIVIKVRIRWVDSVVDEVD